MQQQPTDLVHRPLLNHARRRAWIWAAGGLAAALVIAGLALCVGEWTAALEHWMLGRGIWGVAIFAGIFIAATLVLAPDWPLAIIAGMLYGIWAFPVVLAAAVVAASLAFLTARYLLRERVRMLLASNRKFAVIDNAVTEEGWKIVLLLRPARWCRSTCRITCSG